MKLRTIGAVLAGAAMIGATVAGAAAAAAVPGRDWWVDPATGMPNVTIAVGAQANASDVVSASLIAAAVGNMATVEKTQGVMTTSTANWNHVFPYNYAATDNVFRGDPNVARDPLPNLGAVAAVDPSIIAYNASFDLFSNGVWDTSDTVGVRGDAAPGVGAVNVSIAMPGNVVVGQNTYAKELNTLWRATSPRGWFLGQPDTTIYNITASAGGITTINAATLLDRNQQYVVRAYGQPLNRDGSRPGWNWNWNFFDGWSNVWTNNMTFNCYPFGGTQSPMPPHEEIQVIVTDDLDCVGCATDLVQFAGDRGIESGIIYRTTEIRYPLREGGQNICGINSNWGMIDFETTVRQNFYEIKFLGEWYTPLFAGHNFMVTGRPTAAKEYIMQVGDSWSFAGWTVNLLDVNIYENKAYINVTGPNHDRTFIMVMDALNPCQAWCCIACGIYGGGGAFTSNPTGQSEFDPYVVRHRNRAFTNNVRVRDFWWTEFMLDGIKTFIGADGTYLAEFNIYVLADPYVFISTDCCDPFVTTPNNYSLSITGGWAQMTTEQPANVSANVSVVQFGSEVELWFDEAQRPNNNFGFSLAAEDANTTLIQWQPVYEDTAGFVSNPNAQFDTLELRLCDDIIVPDCDKTFTVYGPNNYFQVVVGDADSTPIRRVDFDNPWGTTRVRIRQTAPVGEITYTETVRIDPVDLIKLDVEVNTATNTKNLVLVGGPVYNTLVKDLVDMGASTVDWATSMGEWEWIADPMARGFDVLIVAGANREETRMAAEDLIRMLN